MYLALKVGDTTSWTDRHRESLHPIVWLCELCKRSSRSRVAFHFEQRHGVGMIAGLVSGCRGAWDFDCPAEEASKMDHKTDHTGGNGDRPR